MSPESSDQRSVSKLEYCLLRMFYVNNQNDDFIRTISDMISDLSVEVSRPWVEELISQIQSLPVLGPLQSQKTDYVVLTLRQKLDEIATKQSSGLPAI